MTARAAGPAAEGTRSVRTDPERYECNRQGIKTQLWRKYNIKAKAIDVVIEELKQCITAKAYKI